MQFDPRPGHSAPVVGTAPSARIVTPGPAADIDPASLLAAVEHAADSIVITTLDGIVTYVNAAYERETGLTRSQVVGNHTSAFDTGRQPFESMLEMVATVRAGGTWKGEFLHLNADGARTHLAATVSPVFDRAGTPIGAVAVRRDVTAERALEASKREQVELAAAFAAMAAGETAEETATAIVTPLLALAGLAGAGLWSFGPGGEITPLAIVDRTGGAWCPGRPMPAERAAILRERSEGGPWIEDAHPVPERPSGEPASGDGAPSVACLPVRAEGDVVGLLILAGDGTDVPGLDERLSDFAECASVAGALLGPQLRKRAEVAAHRVRIRSIIADRAFFPVFQPIVELAGRTAVGYEALTRFADGTRPDLVFAEASAGGLSVELETATLEATLEASGPLPASAWLNLNVSPELVLAGDPLGSILRRWGWQIVLELTEHIQVTDYVALRAALERLGPKVRLAVDDAGAGFASLRHILELRPDYVKLDRAIVHGIGSDPARQALVAGMAHFARQTRTTLVAEGVETEAEARTLSGLGIRLAQGFHLARPAVVAELLRPAGAADGLAGPHGHGRHPAGQDDDAAVDIACAVNIGTALAAALGDLGLATVADLRHAGAIPTWQRLRRSNPGLATGATLIKLEGATRGLRVSRLAEADRSRLLLLARRADQTAEVPSAPA